MPVSQITRYQFTPSTESCRVILRRIATVPLKRVRIYLTFLHAKNMHESIPCRHDDDTRQPVDRRGEQTQHSPEFG